MKKNIKLEWSSPLTEAEFGEVLSGTFNCSDKGCECCNYLLINDHYTFKNVQITFKLKYRVTWNSFNLIYVVICDTCKEEYIEETGEGKTKLRERVRVYRRHIRQPQYQQLKVGGHLKVCGHGKFQIFPLLQVRSQDTNLRWSYETRFQQKFKTKLNKLWWETYARKIYKNPSIVKQLFITCIISKTDVANLQSN